MSDLTVTLNELAKLLHKEYGVVAAEIVAEARDTIERHEAALKRIAEMTDIEADFDGFEARQIAEDALAAGSRRAETNEDLAQCEASQSGAAKTAQRPTSGIVR